MNVGIMSMQRIHNYGSFLQAYSLKRNLEMLGNQVQFVDYHIGPFLTRGGQRPTKMLAMRQRAYSTARRTAGSMYRLVNRQMARKRQDADRFGRMYRQMCSEHLGMTGAPNYLPELELLVIGSDEVFNCLQRNPKVGYSPELFGRDCNAGRLISYAASFGNTTLEKLERFHLEDEIRDRLSRFDAVSVRDCNSAQIVRALGAAEPHFHLDPVFIYDYQEETRSFSPQVSGEYIVVYAYSGRITPEEAEGIARYAKGSGKKLLCIGHRHPFCDDYIMATPFELLGYIRGASAVITDTFHGSVFSIKYRRPFAVLVRDSAGTAYGNSEKLVDLLRRFSMTDRIVSDIASLQSIMNMEISFAGVQEKIASETASSREYLRKWASSFRSGVEGDGFE